MRAEPNYRGVDIEVTAVQDERGWNAQVLIRLPAPAGEPHVEGVPYRRPTADDAERRGGIYARRWVDRHRLAPSQRFRRAAAGEDRSACDPVSHLEWVDIDEGLDSDPLVHEALRAPYRAPLAPCHPILVRRDPSISLDAPARISLRRWSMSYPASGIGSVTHRRSILLRTRPISTSSPW